MTKTIDRIKQAITSDHPIVVIPADHDRIQEFYLYQFTDQETSLIQGHIVPSRAYLLVSANMISKLNSMLPLSRVMPEPVRSFVLPYLPNTVGEITLDDSSIDLVVTARLTGCTITAETTDHPTLRHLNYRYTHDDGDDVFDKINQPRIDTYIQKSSPGEELFVIRKPDYSPESEQPDFKYTQVN